MKFNKLNVKNMCNWISLFLLAIFISSCATPAIPKSPMEFYPQLYNAIYQRHADAILAFTTHSSEAIRQQAWRGMINTPVDSLDDFIVRVKQSEEKLAWVALSMKKLDSPKLNSLLNVWENNPSHRAGISMVLGQQGTKEHLDFLIRNTKNFIDTDYEFESALAISRLVSRHEISLANKEKILERAIAVQQQPNLLRAYLYGFYRSGKAISDKELLDRFWDIYSELEDPLSKQYILSMLFRSDMNATEKLDISNLEEMNVQLVIALAGFSSRPNWGEKLENIYTKLLKHANPLVNEVTLKLIDKHPIKPLSFDDTIIGEIINNENKVASIRLSGIEALANKKNFLALADSLSANKDYLLIKKLQIYSEAQTIDEFLAEIATYSNSDNRMEVLFAVQALSSWWPALPVAEKNAERTETVREILFNALEKGDRSITYKAGPLLMVPNIIRNDDYPQLEKLLSKYSLPEDVEVYQAVAGFFKHHFEKEAKAFIDSLAAKGNSALNTTLRQQGWEISQEIKQTPQSFKKPNWNRLVELGSHPVWVLETEKGSIEIEMNTFVAPATISAMDSLITTGEYDGVAFHRVVPNFVTQGGDVETGDGFGGPNYVVPTEASEKQYWRGTVGIASAGTDTEGSQYFIMHQWAPHLNGRYTIIGNVTGGMDAVDKLLIGDKVLRTYWK